MSFADKTLTCLVRIKEMKPSGLVWLQCALISSAIPAGYPKTSYCQMCNVCILLTPLTSVLWHDGLVRCEACW